MTRVRTPFLPTQVSLKLRCGFAPCPPTSSPPLCMTTTLVHVARLSAHPAYPHYILRRSFFYSQSKTVPCSPPRLFPPHPPPRSPPRLRKPHAGGTQLVGGHMLQGVPYNPCGALVLQILLTDRASASLRKVRRVLCVPHFFILFLRPIFFPYAQHHHAALLHTYFSLTTHSRRTHTSRFYRAAFVVQQFAQDRPSLRSGRWGVFFFCLLPRLPGATGRSVGRSARRCARGPRHASEFFCFTHSSVSHPVSKKKILPTKFLPVPSPH